MTWWEIAGIALGSVVIIGALLFYALDKMLDSIGNPK